MIIYLDTSAVVPLLVREPSSASCLRVWNASDDAVTCRLTYVETAAALAQALRNKRMTAGDHRAALARLEGVWRQCDVIDIDQPVAVSAAALAHQHGLRGYDAVHCAAALRLEDEELVAVSGDHALLQAWTALGVATYDTNAGGAEAAV